MEGEAGMNEEQLEFPVVSGKAQAKSNDLDYETRIGGRHFCPRCGQDAAHTIVSNYQLCDKCDFDYGRTARAYFERSGKSETQTQEKAPGAMGSKTRGGGAEGESNEG